MECRSIHDLSRYENRRNSANVLNMGQGIDLARDGAPVHAEVLDDFKDQLLIAFLRRLGGKCTIPVKEIDATGGFTLSFSVNDGAFRFVLGKKQ